MLSQKSIRTVFKKGCTLLHIGKVWNGLYELLKK